VAALPGARRLGSMAPRLVGVPDPMSRGAFGKAAVNRRLVQATQSPRPPSARMPATMADDKENSEQIEVRIFCGVKPFGKDGVRLGWQCEAKADGLLYVECRLADTGAWVQHSELHTGGKPSGVLTIKASDDAAPPAKHAWRVRSATGDASPAARLGVKPPAGTAMPLSAAPTSAGPSDVSTLSDAELVALVESRQGEVDCLLRPTLTSAATFESTRTAVDAAVAFDVELGATAERKGCIKGKLFQSLLENLRAQGAGHAQMDNSVKLDRSAMGFAREFGLNLAEWASLTIKADELRNLVRIKVADDNDLRTARSGLVLCAEFFRALERLAVLRNAANGWDVLQQLRPN